MATRVASMFVIALAAGVMPNAQSTFMSAPLAGTLSRLFENTGTYAFAAPDPEETGRFVAVIYVPGGKLFVVSAESDMPDAISRSIADHAYRDVYLALQAASTGKFYVEDARANGLLHALSGSDAVDFVYDGRRTTRFNSDPQSQYLSGSEYDTRFAEADQRYAHMLHVLIDAVRAHVRGAAWSVRGTRTTPSAPAASQFP
jgi:hypothetical protein